jgi:hypothetical protein
VYAENDSATEYVITRKAIGELKKKASIPMKGKDTFVFLSSHCTPLCSKVNLLTEVVFLAILNILSRFFKQIGRIF